MTKYSNDLIDAAYVFLQACISEMGENGEEKAHAMMDAFDPKLKNQLLMAVLTENIYVPVKIKKDVSKIDHKYINAIKEIRGIYGLSLKEAKDLIDQCRDNEIATMPTRISVKEKIELRQKLHECGFIVI